MATILDVQNVDSAASSLSSAQSMKNNGLSNDDIENCCNHDTGQKNAKNSTVDKSVENLQRSCKVFVEDSNRVNSYAGNKNVAEGLMDIALLSANANQLRFLITYNHEASTYYISLTMVAVSLIMQITVGIALIFKRRYRRCRSKRCNEFILGGVFLITVVNILLAAFTTTTESRQ